ncbi:MAG: hypothetical protein ACHQIK_09455 [Candidatus Acidiferrales bacterium]
MRTTHLSLLKIEAGYFTRPALDMAGSCSLLIVRALIGMNWGGTGIVALAES